MIKLTVEDDGKAITTQLEVAGTLKEIIMQAIAGLAAVYNTVGDWGPEQASLFKGILAKSVNDPDSPIWNSKKAHNGVSIHATVPVKEGEKE